VSVVGRVLLCTIFFMAAVGNKIPNFQAVAGYMAIGAMLLIIVNGTGRLSLDGRRSKVGEEPLSTVGATR
jgi:hypothetical protein